MEPHRTLDVLQRSFVEIIERESGPASDRLERAADVRLLAGSMYHHFASKDEMLFEACRVGVERVIGAHNAPIEDLIEPWARLKAACASHPECLLIDDSLA